jgi:ferredoxin
MTPPVAAPVLPPAPAAAPTPVAPAPAPVAATPTAPAAEASEESTEGKGAGKYLVKVINNKCIGAASCVAVAPNAFKLNDKQIAEVLASVNQETDDNLLLAAQSCPTLAIEVIDTETGQKVWPK